MPLPAPGPEAAAIVTGASSGIGEAIARELARRGHQVILVARRADRLREIADGLGAPAHVLPADLSRRSDRAALPDEVAELGLTPDILINNAGISVRALAAASIPEEQLDMVEVDVAAVVDLCSRFLPGMVARRRGAVLNMSSSAALGPSPGNATYGAAKAFVLAYTENLRCELLDTGVTATALCPGPVTTGFVDKGGWSKEELETALPRVLWSSPEKVAKAGIDGLASGKGVVIPGRANKAAATMLRLVPHGPLLPMLARGSPLLNKE